MKNNLSSAGLGVAYEPLAALLYYIDESESFRFGKFDDTNDVPAYLKSSLRFKDWWRRHLHQENGTDLLRRFEARKPLWIHTFGPSDSISLMMLDEVDLLPALTPIQGPKIERVTVAFCPNIDELGIPRTFQAQEDQGQPTPFGLAWDDLLTPGATDEQPYQVELERPVALVTKFKMNGGVALEYGGLFERAIFRAAARAILQTRHRLKQLAREAGKRAYFSIDDVEAYRCFFLDVQGSEDLLLLSFGTNLSVAASFVIGLRCLTFREICLPVDNSDMPTDAGDHWFCDLIAGNASSAQRLWLKLWETMSPGTDQVATDSGSPVDGLADNHIFSFVYSTPGVSAPALDKPDRVAGWVEVSRLLDFSPGHGLDLLPLYSQGKEQFSVPGGAKKLGTEAEWYTIGRHDLILSAEVKGTGKTATLSFVPHPVRAILFRDFVGYWRKHFLALHEKLAKRTQQAGIRYYETGLLDQSSSLTVPVPAKALLKEVGPQHVPNLALLDQLGKALARPLRIPEPTGLPVTSWDRTPFRRPEWVRHRFDVEALDLCARQLGFPWPFRTRFRQLYTNFLNSFSDTVLFPSVLDLYDSLHALYYLIVDDYTEVEFGRRSDPRGQGGPCSSTLTREDLSTLDNYLNALEDAFTHRIARSLPNHESRELSPALRGSLTKMVSASDAVLKCGLGLVRRLLDPDRRGERTYLVAGIARMNFHTRTYLNQPIEGLRERKGQHGPILLARLDMNISHIFCPEELPKYLHEIGHIVFQIKGERILTWIEDVPNEVRVLFRDLLEEVFVELLTHFFIYRGDVQLFSRFSVALYNESRAGAEPTIVLRRFVEFMFRMFLIHLLMEKYGKAEQPGDWKKTDENVQFPPLDQDEVSKKFVNYITEFGPFFSEFQSLWSPKEDRELKARNYAEAWCKLNYSRLAEALPLVWNTAVEAYAGYVMGEAEDGVRKLRPEDAESLNQRLNAALASGRPCLRRDPYLIVADRGEIAPLPFVCHLLYVYLKRYYLPLDPNTLHLSGTQEVDARSSWRIDPTQPGLLCLSPEDRRHRTRFRIAFLKSLWDLSTEFRARRLCDIIQNCAATIEIGTPLA